MKTQAQISAIIEELKQLYPDALCSLEYQKDYELLFSVRLAAQCTDARVNLVTPALFERFPTLEAFAAATPDEVGEYVRSCGFWRAKAKDIVDSCHSRIAFSAGILRISAREPCTAHDHAVPSGGRNRWIPPAGWSCAAAAPPSGDPCCRR